MSVIPQEKLDKLMQRFELIQEEMNQGAGDQAKFAQLSKEYAELNPLIMVIEELRAMEAEEADLKAMADESGGDREMSDLARDELQALQPRLEELRQSLRLLLLPKDAADDKSAILEIRAGTGGDEAALFAADLFRMYSRFAELQGWKVEVISSSPSDLGGYREIIASVKGKGVFAKMKYESGGHRVQRIPTTESGGRIHTSAATVAVLPEAEDIEFEIKPEEIRIDTMRASGAGGQHVNTTDSAVRITHLPTGIMVVSAEKSQHQNRRLAMDVLRSRLYAMQRQKVDDERAAERKDQIGSGDRSQRIRTYNFPQGRVTDHRINLTLHKLDSVIAGDGLGEIVAALITDHQANQLAQMNG